MARERRGTEWPTLALLLGCYALWGAVVWYAAEIGLWVAVPVTALTLALHSSLQHEALHGHPTRHAWLNEALVFPALGLAIPYRRFRDTHLAHHHNELLTDPYDDPESNYLDPKIWRELPKPARAVLRFNNTLLGRMIVGPLIGQIAFMRAEAQVLCKNARSQCAEARFPCVEARVLCIAWGLHLLGLIPVAIWLSGSSMPLWAYGLSAYFGLSILKIRTFLEHRADERVAGRSVIVEDRGPMALLFLNNNFHAVHHAHPQVAWYDLPALYRSRQDLFLRRNGGYRYGSYAEIARAHFLRAKDPVAHPLMDE